MFQVYAPLASFSARQAAFFKSLNRAGLLLGVAWARRDVRKAQVAQDSPDRIGIDGHAEAVLRDHSKIDTAPPDDAIFFWIGTRLGQGFDLGFLIVRQLARTSRRRAIDQCRAMPWALKACTQSRSV